MLGVFKRPSALLITRLLHISAAASNFGFSWSESQLRSIMSGIIRMILLLALAVCVCQAQRECFHRCSAVVLHMSVPASTALTLTLSLSLSRCHQCTAPKAVSVRRSNPDWSGPSYKSRTSRSTVRPPSAPEWRFSKFTIESKLNLTTKKIIK